MHRRTFVGDVARAGVAAAIIPRAGFTGRRLKSDAINVACIGVGGMGFQDIRNIAAVPDVNISAVCDVDYKAAAEAFGLFPQAKRYRDYTTRPAPRIAGRDVRQ